MKNKFSEDRPPCYPNTLENKKFSFSNLDVKVCQCCTNSVVKKLVVFSENTFSEDSPIQNYKTFLILIFFKYKYVLFSKSATHHIL